MEKERKGALNPKLEIPQSLIKVNSIEEVIQNEIKKFDVKETDIDTAVEAYGKLKIIGIDDKEGYDAVYQARVVFRNMRTAIEERRKELKADSLKIGRAIDVEASRLTGKFLPVEGFLVAQVKLIDNEKERLKLEEKEKVEREKRQRIEGRVNKLRGIGFQWFALHDVFTSNDQTISIDVLLLDTMPDEDFQDFYNTEALKYTDYVIAEQRRKAEAEQLKKEADIARKADEERLAKERAEFARKTAELLETEKAREVLRKAEEERLAKIKAEQEAQAELLRLQEEEIRKNKEEVIKVRHTADFTEAPCKFSFTEERIPIGAITSEDLKQKGLPVENDITDVRTKLIVIKSDMDVYTLSDADLEKLRKDVIVLLGKTITHIDKGIDVWQTNQK